MPDLGDNGRVLCQDQGPIEATTQAMADLFSRPWPDAEKWINMAIETGSLPLLHRLTIAMRTVQVLNIPDLSEWANVMPKDRILPTLNFVLQTIAGGTEIGLD